MRTPDSALRLAILASLACTPTPAANTTSGLGTTPVAGSEDPVEVAPAVASRPPNTLERGVINRLMERAALIRQLRFLSPVRVEIESSERIASQLESQIEDEDVERASLVYGTLGLLPPDTDVRELLVSVLGEQVVGYYDASDERLVVRNDVMGLLASRPGSSEALEAGVVIVHELVHALQDQHLGLGDLYEQERDSDADSALRSLVEGDATLAMILHAAAGVPPALVVDRSAEDADLQAMAEMPTGSDPALAQAPAILRVTLVAPYIAGLAFVAREHRDLGGFAAIDRAFSSLPASMEQVLHENRRHDPPESVVLPELPEFDAAGFEVVEEDTLGELELGVYLAIGSPLDIHTDGAAGWGGDRLRIYRRGDERLAVWMITFDDEDEAIEAEPAARLAGGHVERGGRALCIRRGAPADLAAIFDQECADFVQALPARPSRAPSQVAP